MGASESKATAREFNEIKNLTQVQNDLIFRFGYFSKQAQDPQLREAFQKMCASARNHKQKLLKSLQSDGES